MKKNLLIKSFQILLTCKNSAFYRLLIGVLLLWTAAACSWTTGAFSKKQSGWEGIWQAKVEDMPGFRALAEFVLQQNSFKGAWRGSWRISEIMSIDSFEREEVMDSGYRKH